MLDKVMEAVLYLALFAACGAVLVFGIITLTPGGRRWRESLDRRRAMADGGGHCAVHGSLREEEMMRLASGERICPHCFRESVRAARQGNER